MNRYVWFVRQRYLACVLLNKLNITFPKHGTWCPLREMSHQNMAQTNTTQFPIWRIEWFSSGPYFGGSFFVIDFTFCSILWASYVDVQCVEQHVHQISLTYTPYLPVNGFDSVSKRCGSAILDDGHCTMASIGLPGFGATNAILG